jgi:hypothetical protein
MNLFQRARLYRDGMRILLDWTHNSGELVAKEVAQARANVCAACPKNVKDWPVTEAVAQAIKQHVGLKNSLGVKLDNEDKLMTCSACGCVNSLKVWLPIQFVYPTEEMKAKLDAKCWLLNQQ